jgi:hypothetical protein
MAADELLIAAGMALAVGGVLCMFRRPELITGIGLPLTAPEFTAEFVGDFLLAVGVGPVGLWAVDATVGVPTRLLQAVGVAVVVAVLALPTLAEYYVSVRTGQTENV